MNDTFDGKIVRFSEQIDMQTRTMHTEVDVPNPKYELVPGMYASVQIPLHAAANVLTVPIQAVQSSGEWEGHRAGREQREPHREDATVKLGLQTATDVEIAVRAEGERAWWSSASRLSTEPASWSSPQDAVHCARGIRSSLCRHFPYDILISSS